MSEDADETEHSMEMHLPYIHKMVSRAFASPEEYPTLVPILVGNTNEAAEKTYGAILAEYLADEQNAFVVSSDFCHWGTRFQYTYYLPSEAAAEASRGVMLKRRDKTPTDPHICDSIGTLDNLAMKAIESGAHSTFLTNLKDTGNTVCGRHPIGVLMAAVEVLREKEEGKDGKFKFLRYERSSEVVDISDSSVSYASAYAVI
jgi:AmmeMemoRadiSam system protein B